MQRRVAVEVAAAFNMHSAGSVTRSSARCMLIWLWLHVVMHMTVMENGVLLVVTALHVHT